MAGKIFIVTGAGKYFKNVKLEPENNSGIVRIAEDGVTAELLWGFRDGGKFTSEFPAHLPRINTIRDEELIELAEFFGVNYRKDFLGE